MTGTRYKDPVKDVRAMRNMIDVNVTLTGMSAGMEQVRRDTARKLLNHCEKTGLSASEVESFREMAIGLLDFRSEDKSAPVSYHYCSDGGTLKLNPLAGASACLPNGIRADITLTRDSHPIVVSDDITDVGYWNYVSLCAERGNFTRQSLGHCPEGNDEPDAASVHDIEEGNFCSSVEELGYMAMAFSTRESALRQQRERQAEAERVMQQGVEQEGLEWN